MQKKQPQYAQHLRAKATVTERPFTSPFPLVAQFRSLWNSIAAKWYVRPLLAQQNEFNQLVAEQLIAQTTRLEAEIDQMVAIDRELVRLRHETAVASLPNKPPTHIAYFSPLPPQRSGIADYSAELLPHLSKLISIDLFTETPAQISPHIRQQFNVYPISDYPKLHQQYDLALYQLGNSAHHAAALTMFLRYPGVIVLHDANLHHFINHRTLAQADHVGYSREMGYELGRGGTQLASDIRLGYAQSPTDTVSLNQKIMDLSLGVIGHSQFVQKQLKPRFGQPTRVIPALIEAHPGKSRRHELNLPDDALLFGSFGHVTARRQFDQALAAFQRLRETHPNAHYLIVGELLDVDLGKLIAQHNLAGFVHHIGYVASLSVFVDWIHSVDVVINLRHPTAGETSATALRAMGAKRPLIVTGQGWYSEIPDAACLKVPPSDEKAIHQAMQQLANSAAKRQAMGAAGHQYIHTTCQPAQIATSYIQFLEKITHLSSKPNTDGKTQTKRKKVRVSPSV